MWWEFHIFFIQLAKLLFVLNCWVQPETAASERT